MRQEHRYIPAWRCQYDRQRSVVSESDRLYNIALWLYWMPFLVASIIMAGANLLGLAHINWAFVMATAIFLPFVVGLALLAIVFVLSILGL
ncbi:MAG: hypothetical protein U0800_27620 [Isosphaeraceae bacterium]